MYKHSSYRNNLHQITWFWHDYTHTHTPDNMVLTWLHTHTYTKHDFKIIITRIRKHDFNMINVHTWWHGPRASSSVVHPAWLSLGCRPSLHSHYSTWMSFVSPTPHAGPTRKKMFFIIVNELHLISIIHCYCQCRCTSIYWSLSMQYAYQNLHTQIHKL